MPPRFRLASLRRLYRLPATALLASLLAACGGGGGSSAPAEFGPMPVRTLVPGEQQVSVPLSGPSLVHVQVVDFPERNLPDIPVGSQGKLALTVPVDLESRLLRLTLNSREVREEAANADGDGDGDLDVDTSEYSTPDHAVLLVTGAQLNRGGVAFNPLTDYIARRMDAYTQSLTDERLAYYQDALALELIAYDLDGDGLVDFNDALAFDPANAEHVRRLRFDYGARVTMPLLDERSLLQIYAIQPDDLPEALDLAFDAEDGSLLPGPDLNAVTLLHADTNKGGRITIAELPGVELDEANSRLLQRDAINTDSPRRYTLRAAPDTGWRFVRWVGCDTVEAERCTVAMSESKDVSALFAYEQNVLAEGIAGVVRLMEHAADGHVLEQPDAATLRISGVRDAALNAELLKAGVGTVIATGDWRAPMLKIAQAPAAPQLVDGAHTYVFAVESTTYLDVYQTLSTFASDAPISIDEVAQAKLTLPGDEPGAASSSTMKTSVAGTSAAQGSGGAVWVVGHGRAFDVGHGYFLVQNANGTGLALAKAEGAVQAVPQSKVLKTLRNACAADASGPDCGLLQKNQTRAVTVEVSPNAKCNLLGASCNLPVVEIKWTGQKWGDKQTGGQLGATLRLEGDLQLKVAHSAMHFMWSILSPGIDFSMNTRGQADIAIGLGLFAGLEGKYTANRNLVMKGKEAQLKEIARLKDEKETQERVEAFERWYSLHDPAFDGAADKVGSNVSVSALEDAANAAEEGRPRSNAINYNATGRPRSNAFSFRFEPNPEAKSSEQSAAALSIVLNRSTPDGAVMPLTFKIDVGIRGKGKLGLEASLVKRVKIPFEVDVDVGSRCRNEHYWWGSRTYCQGGKPQRMEAYAKVKSYQDVEVKAVANAQIGPYLDFSLNYGPAFLKEDLIKISAGPSIMFNMAGSVGWKHSDMPEHKAEYAGLPEGCFRSPVTFAMGADLVMGATAKIDATFEYKIFKINLYEREIFKKEHKIPLLEPVLYKGGLEGGAGTDACLPASARPARLMEETFTWKPGQMMWDEPNFVLTRTHKIALLDNGGIRIYKLARKDGGAGGVDKETELSWPKGPVTSTYPGARIAFQEDGNLVVYSVAEKVLWSSNTWRRNAANMRMVLEKTGDLVIYDGNDAIWRSDTRG